ncbi:ABC transporter ATP-binding protein [bacterium]|nr:MAG: ABC transporter ATP-binding protein [bacterium]
MEKNIIEITGLTKIYSPRKNPVHALKGISFSVQRGEIFGMLGVNGAGKSTTMNILIGLLTPTSGKITIMGKDFIKHEEAVKGRMNIATAYADLPNGLTVYQNLRVYSFMYGIKNGKQKIAELVEQFGVSHLLRQSFDELSAGQKTRINLCKALLNDPEVLLLDEPTASLDPSIAAKVRKILLDMQRSRRLTIVLTSHNMLEVEQMCDRVALLDKGEIYKIDTPKNLQKFLKVPDMEQVFMKLAQGEFDE